LGDLGIKGIITLVWIFRERKSEDLDGSRYWERLESKDRRKPEPREGTVIRITYSGRTALRREQCGVFAQSKNCGGRETAVAS
jgi:hypothetical protein